MHDYYNCFANLYGVIMVKEAWDIFRHYEGIGLIHKKDFIAFSGIVQREPGHLYSIFENLPPHSRDFSRELGGKLLTIIITYGII